MIKTTIKAILILFLFRGIGLICHEENPGVINLVEGCQVSAQNFHSEPNVKQFFISLSSHVEQGGSFDIFTPLAASGKYSEFNYMIYNHVFLKKVIYKSLLSINNF